MPGRAARRGGREAGWRQALTETAAPIPEVVHAGWDARSAYEAGRVLAEDGDVTAILCGNDDTALAVRRALYDAGRDVPGEVSLVGFDDVPGSAYWTPALHGRPDRLRGPRARVPVGPDGRTGRRPGSGDRAGDAPPGPSRVTSGAVK
ncbi:substrate-binding domain-containing protein [Spirillospora sp. CA-128828]|uniref:substrate-binding domain-containing protein n=1 Tax=Spirillospora sp. CA-128828 TaxID=3240033 RepID=UPI003D8C03A3